MELFAKRMTWELDNEEGLSCLSFELEDGYFTLSRKTGAEALRLEMNDPANGQLIDPDCFEYALDNFFGLSIAYDPYKRELVDGKTLTTCGGDGGCNVCGGMGPLLGYLPCSPHCKPEVREDNEIHNDYDFFRPVIRVQTSGWRMVIDRAQE